MALGLSGVLTGMMTDFDQKHVFLENRRLAGAREGAQQNVVTCAQSLRLRARERVFVGLLYLIRADTVSAYFGIRLFVCMGKQCTIADFDTY